MEKDNLFLKQSNLTKKIDKRMQNNDIRDLFAITFTTYRISKFNKMIFKFDPTCAIPKKLIELYLKNIKPDYNRMIYSFREKYIDGESVVEKNDILEQVAGLSLVYDYIQNFDFKENDFDIFLSSLYISSLLWKPTDDKNNSEFELDVKLLREKAKQLMIEAKEEHNISKYKESQKILKECNESSNKTKIGGQFRENDVKLAKTDIEIPSSREALILINNYNTDKKRREFKNALHNYDSIEYIAYCVREICKLIKIQPFVDGNKRTFRSLLNLMFKAKGLPPVYIEYDEREQYKDALFKALRDDNFSEIIGFYLFKICDSIYELDIIPYQEKRINDYKHEKIFGEIGSINKN